MDARVIGDIVSIVPQGRRVKRQKPQSGDAKILQIIELLHQPAKVPPAVTDAVVKRPNMQLIDDCVFVPRGVLRHRWIAPGFMQPKLRSASGVPKIGVTSSL